MISYNDSSPQVLEFDSPIEFILVSTTENGRKVVARSKGAKMDLPFFSHFKSSDYDLYQSVTRSVWAEIFYPAVESLYPVTLHSQPVSHPNNFDFDQRPSTLTFVWRGVRAKDYIDDMQSTFDSAAPHLAMSVREHDLVEWILSPLIAHCAISLEASRQRRLAKAARAKLMMGVVIGYSVVAALASCYYFVFR